MSILNTRFETPYNTAPFSKIKTEAFLPALKKPLKMQRMKLIKLLRIMPNQVLKTRLKHSNLRANNWIGSPVFSLI